MKVSKNSLALAAAFAGLVSGTAAYASQPAGSLDSRTISAAGQLADITVAKKEIEKHACKGMNSCKGIETHVKERGQAGPSARVMTLLALSAR